MTSLAVQSLGRVGRFDCHVQRVAGMSASSLPWEAVVKAGLTHRPADSVDRSPAANRLWLSVANAAAPPNIHPYINGRSASFLHQSDLGVNRATNPPLRGITTWSVFVLAVTCWLCVMAVGPAEGLS